jgi:uncharacterized protein YxeA
VDQNLNQEQEAKQAVEVVMPKQKKPGRAALQVFAILVMVGLVGFGVYAWQNNRVAQLNQQLVDLKKETAPVTKTTTDSYADWKTYTSKVEKSTFKYPTDWKLTADTPTASDEYKDADAVKVTSPSGNVVVSWTSVVDGIGGGCSEDTCPYMTTLGSTLLASVKDRYINYGAISQEGKTYNPFMAIQDNIQKIGDSRDLFFGFFTAKNNGSINPSGNGNVGAGLSLSNAVNGKITDAKLNKNQASTYFEKPEVKQARLILESYSY